MCSLPLFTVVDQEQELRQWWRVCCEAQDTISEQQNSIEENYAALSELASIASQYDSLIESQERKIKRLERCLSDVDSLPEYQREGAASRLESQIETRYEAWWGLLDERDVININLFHAVDNIPLLKTAKERLEYNAFMAEVGHYAAICQQQMQEWVDAGCPDDDDEEQMN